MTRSQFSHNGTLPVQDDTRMPRPVSDDWIVAAVGFSCNITAVGPSGCGCERTVYLAYDDIYAVELNHSRIPAFWRAQQLAAHPGSDPMLGLLDASAATREWELAACAAFDEELAATLFAAGGEEYKEVAALAYRQTVGANQLAVAADGSLVHFSRECGSGDDILTMDVVIDSLPFFLWFSPVYVFAELRPIIHLASNLTVDAGGMPILWSHPYTPHDMGKYPIANGYDGGPQETMPLEETGNALIMIEAACARQSPTSACEFASRHWAVITRWANYLNATGLYPAKQLSSDDFDGPLANRSNLAAKAIIGVGAYAQLATRQGLVSTGQLYRGWAEAMAAEWMQLAADGDHYSLQYSTPGWALMYNLWLDSLLGTRLFGSAVTGKLKVFYATRVQEYGLPLDPRHNYTVCMCVCVRRGECFVKSVFARWKWLCAECDCVVACFRLICGCER